MNAHELVPATAETDIATAIRQLLERADADPEFVAPIVHIGAPVLRQPSMEFDGQIAPEELEQFLKLMRRTMLAAPGVGLAAPQIGIPVRIAVVEDKFPISEDIALTRERRPLDFTAFINPRYRPIGMETARFYEGCLSFSGFQGVVGRHHTVEVSYQTRAGDAVAATFGGWQARILQHECDHLDGTVYVDKMLSRSLTTSDEYAARWNQPTIELAAERLGF